MKAKAFMFLRYAIGGLGIYLALSQASTNPANAAAVASLLAVGFVGVLSFVSHVLLSDQDSKQIGFGSKEKSFQYEVGFANLAIGVAAIISYSAGWGIHANTTLLFIYALYLMQAGLLHAYVGLRSPKARSANLKRAIPTFVFSGALYYIFYLALTSGQF